MPADKENGDAAYWFDPLLLASYMVSTLNFTHPISRRDLSRAECEALDKMLKAQNRHDKLDASVADVFINKDKIKDEQADARSRQQQDEAATLLQQLVGAITMAPVAQPAARAKRGKGRGREARALYPTAEAR
jgi:hypothetical protein